MLEYLDETGLLDSLFLLVIVTVFITWLRSLEWKLRCEASQFRSAASATVQFVERARILLSRPDVPASVSKQLRDAAAYVGEPELSSRQYIRFMKSFARLTPRRERNPLFSSVLARFGRLAASPRTHFDPEVIAWKASRPDDYRAYVQAIHAAYDAIQYSMMPDWRGVDAEVKAALAVPRRTAPKLSRPIHRKSHA